MKKILLATGDNALNGDIKKTEKVDVVGEVNFREELEQACEYHNPEILFVTDEVGGHSPLPTTLLILHAKFPGMRIIYWTGADFTRNETAAIQLGTLASVGIYDIIVEKTINTKLLLQIIEFPKERDNVLFFIEKVEKATKRADATKKSMKVEDLNATETIDTSIQRVVSFYSAKPGTGKTTLAINTAIAIASRGKGENGKKPRVLLLEADLQNLSVGTALDMRDEKKNLSTVLKELKKIIINNTLIENEEKIEEAESNILRAVLTHPTISNLHVICDSNLSNEAKEGVTFEHYNYLLDLLNEHYDVIILDANSDLNHPTAVPVFVNSKQCFYISNLDFNNVANAFRYREELRKLGFNQKLRFVLNEYISHEHPSNKVEKLEFTAEKLERETGIDFDIRVPLIEKTIFYNRMFAGLPIMLDDFHYPPTMEFRLKILEIAELIYPVEGINELKRQLHRNPEEKKGLGRFFGR